jgi:hypothetical protein
MSGRHGKKNKQKPAQQKPAVGDALPISPTASQAHGEPEQESEAIVKSLKWTHKPDAVNIAIAGLMIAMVGAVIYYFQLREMHRSLVLDERAWVGLDSITIPGFAANKPFFINVTFKNSGKTFAKKVGIEARLDPITKNSSGSSLSGQEISAKGLMPPNGNVFVSLDPTAPTGSPPGVVKQEGYDAVEHGVVVLRIQGKVTYWDIFHINHWLTFCYNMQPNGVFVVCEGETNDTDENE